MEGLQAREHRAAEASLATCLTPPRADLEHFCKEVEQRTGRRVDAVTSKTIKNKELAAAIERGKVLIYVREEH